MLKLFFLFHFTVDHMGSELKFQEADIQNCVNYDLDNLCTPVLANRLEEFLLESNYDRGERDFVIEGFRHGFDLCYRIFCIWVGRTSLQIYLSQ